MNEEAHSRKRDDVSSRHYLCMRCEMKFDAHHKLRIYIGLYSIPPLSLFKAHFIIVLYTCNNFFRIRTNINCCAVSYYMSTVLVLMSSKIHMVHFKTT